MIALKLLLTIAGALLLALALGIPLYKLVIRILTARRRAASETELGQGELAPTELLPPEEIPWRAPLALALVACLPLLAASSIVVVPSGMGGVRVSQIGGTLPGTLYPGLHFVTPFIESVE
ncbi:MAG: hypothetical protein ABR912_06355, partial [Terracidiphilus sp.]